MKCVGLSEVDAHRKLLSTSPLMSMAGLVAHLRWNEYSWFQLNAVEQGPYAAKGEGASLRYILCHMIEETARHLGHLDIIRELLDGSTSYDRLPESAT
jgi:hypothetical protein